MTRDKYHGEIRNPHGAMENAKALVRVANHLDADTDKSQRTPETDRGPLRRVVCMLERAGIDPERAGFVQA